MSTGELARLLGVKYYQVDYARRVGAVPEPAKKVGGKACWSDDEVEAVRAYFEKRKAGDAAAIAS